MVGEFFLFILLGRAGRLKPFPENVFFCRLQRQALVRSCVQARQSGFGSSPEVRSTVAGGMMSRQRHYLSQSYHWLVASIRIRTKPISAECSPGRWRFSFFSANTHYCRSSIVDFAADPRGNQASRKSPVPEVLPFWSFPVITWLERPAVGARRNCGIARRDGKPQLLGVLSGPLKI